MALVLSFFLASFVATNSDLWMHLATGKLISEGKLEFGVDPYSWATEATEQKPAWIHQSWLFSWIAYQIHESKIGGAGLVIIKAILFTIAIALLSQIGWNAQNRWFIVICLIMAMLAASGRLLLSPTLISTLFIAITLSLLDRAGLLRQPNAVTESTSRLPPWKGGPPEGWLWYLVPLFALWANLDAWFILGPIILGFAWAGTALARKFGAPLSVPTRTVGMVFGASLIACCVNPFHVRVFQLPPELAYLVLSVTDLVHLPMPGELVAGGRALKELRKLDPELSWTMSPLSPAYWGDVRYGKNIAAIAVYPLLILGVLGFVLVGMKSQKEGPTLQPVRFLVWLALAVPALALYRLIPFFVIVAAPLTAMTLGEFIQWQQSNSSVARGDRGLKVARYASIPFFLLLLVFAWPGWLHGSGDYNSRRRVAWQIRADAGTQSAAETLHALREKGQAKNVFNLDFVLEQDKAVRLPESGIDQVIGSANLFPWIAPGMKHGLDSRLALFAQWIPEYAKLRAGVIEGGGKGEWQAAFDKHQVDQIAVVNAVLSDETGQDNIRGLWRFWVDSASWRHRYVDRRLAVFSWAGAGKTWPITTAYDDLNAQGFGEVPAAARPPARGVTIPTPPTDFAAFLDGTGWRPGVISEIHMQQYRFSISNEIAVNKNARGARFVASCAGFMNGGPEVATSYFMWFGGPKDAAIITPRDIGPPALPLLSVRAARRAMAENPLDVLTNLTLSGVIDNLRRVQEDRWIGYEPQPDMLPAEFRKKSPGWQQIFLDTLLTHMGREHPSPMRDRLRQYQQIASYFHAVQLQPDNEKLHQSLARLYIQQNMLDLALEHMQLAEKALEKRRITIPSEHHRGFDQFLQSYREEVHSFEKNVQQRLAKHKETHTKNNFQSAVAAYSGTYLDLSLGADGKTPFALGKKSLEILGAVSPESVPENERLPFHLFRYDLLLSMGQAELVANELANENVKKSLPAELYARYQFWAAGTIGDYETMDKALTSLAKGLREKTDEQGEHARKLAIASVPSMFAAGTHHSLHDVIWTLASRTLPETSAAYGSLNIHARLRVELYTVMTLHGIILLEAGDTKKAQAIFQQTVSESENFYFGDRPIAVRYLELLNEQRK